MLAACSLHAVESVCLCDRIALDATISQGVEFPCHVLPQVASVVVRPGSLLKRQRGGSSHSPREALQGDPSTWLRNMRAPVEVTPLGAKVVVDPKTGRRLVLGPAVAAKLTAPEVRPWYRRQAIDACMMHSSQYCAAMCGMCSWLALRGYYSARNGG